MGLFNVDGKFYRFLMRFLDMLKLNFLWLVCSIPLVTIGPSTIAAFSVTMEMIDETEGYIAKKFFKTFKANIKNGIPLGLVFLLALWALYIDFQLMMSDENPLMFTIMFILAAFVFVMAFMYAFALEVRYENTLVKTLKNSYDICIRYFVRTLLLVFVIAIEVVVFMFSTTTLFIGILVGPACIMLTISGFAVPFFREIEKEDGAVIKRSVDENEVQEAPASKGIVDRANMNTKNK